MRDLDPLGGPISNVEKEVTKVESKAAIKCQEKNPIPIGLHRYPSSQLTDCSRQIFTKVISPFTWAVSYISLHFSERQKDFIKSSNPMILKMIKTCLLYDIYKRVFYDVYNFYGIFLYKCIQHQHRIKTCKWITSILSTSKGLASNFRSGLL